MIIRTGTGRYDLLDIFPLIFIGVAIVAVLIALITIFIGRKAKNGYRVAAIILATLTFLLFIGALITGIIGRTPKVWSHGIYRNSSAWVCFGLSIAAFVISITAFLIQCFTKNIVSTSQEKVYKEVEVEKESNECIFYQEFSQGAIEVKDGYIVYYKNLLPFTECRKGRMASTVFINDIQHIVYKGCGWFGGVLTFTFKHFNKPLVIHFSKWFVWRRKKLNPKMTPIYEYIKMQVINNNK